MPENPNIIPPVMSIHDRVVNHIAQIFQDTYNVLSNIGTPKHYISSIFPDLILQDKTDNKTRFIIEVKENGGVALSIQAWKSLPSVPATLYIVVPKDLLSEAKKVAQIVGLSLRFGSYTVINDVIDVTFE